MQVNYTSKLFVLIRGFLINRRLYMVGINHQEYYPILTR